MPTRSKKVIDGITFESHGPTAVPMVRLYAWVIWQFPRPRAGGYSGAVHPPEIGHGWLPAMVDTKRGEVLIYANVTEQFASPEAAMKHLDQLL